MDNELFAKINEFLKANGKRELSEDELDQVVGGMITDINQIQTEKDIYEYVYVFLAPIDKNFGRDVAVDIVKSQFPTADIDTYFGNGDLDTLCNFLHQKFIDGSGVN